MRGVLSSWDDAYRETPPWDIGRPQPAFVSLAQNGELNPGRVLDIGCGTGENAIFLAQNGFTVTGIDLAPSAIQAAKRKAHGKGVTVNFQTGDALSLEFDDGFFDNVIDSGLFHTFPDDQRMIFVGEIGRVLRTGGKYFMQCFSEKEPTDWGGPRRITRGEIEQALSRLFRISYIRDALFDTRIHEKGGRAYLTSATRLGK